MRWRSLGRVVTGLLRGLLVLIAVTMIAVLVDVFAGPFVFLATKSSPVELHDGAFVGTIEGAIKGIDPDTRIVRLPHGLFGLASRALVITEETTIAIGAKLGGFDDLATGQLVRARYAVFPDPDRLVAQRIEIVDRLAPEPPRPATVEAEHPRPEQPAASPAGPSHGGAATLWPVRRTKVETPPLPAHTTSPALKEVRRLERLSVPVRPAQDARRAEPVTASPPPAPVPAPVPAPRVSRPPDIVTVSPPAPKPPPPRAQPQPSPDGREAP